MKMKARVISHFIKHQDMRVVCSALIFSFFLFTFFYPENSPGQIHEGYYNFMPSKGKVRLLVIMAETPDIPHTVSKEDMKQKLALTQEDKIISLPEYYKSVSYGKLDLQVTVTDWVKLKDNMTHYAGGRYGRNVANWPKNLGGMVYDAVNAAKKSGINFKDFDNDSDGHVDALMVLHSGPDAAGDRDMNKIWSRIDYISMYGFAPLNIDGVIIDRFCVCPEYFTRKTDTVYVYAHETGHLLGLPDYYDMDASSHGIGSTSLMGTPLPVSGHKTLLGMDAYSRYLLGWLEPQTITQETLITSTPITSSPVAFQMNSSDPS
jgi:immune inhibitor A